MIAFIFPGQGSQYVEMGTDLYREFPCARQVFRRVNKALGFPLTPLMFNGLQERLNDTRYAQPAIVAHSLALVKILSERSVKPGIVAGHSVGEYAAAVAAGALELEDAMVLVWQRGVAMAEAAAEVGGTMAAIIGLDADTVESIVQDAAGQGVCVVANYNTPQQIVISGEKPAVAAAGKAAKQAGARAVIPLKVSGAFHSPLMEPAVARMRPLLEQAAFHDCQIPLVSNVDATARTDADGVRQALIRQITSQVLWEASVREMVRQGADVFIEVGPGQVLARMMDKIDPALRIHSACDSESVLVTIKRLKDRLQDDPNGGLN